MAGTKHFATRCGLVFVGLLGLSAERTSVAVAERSKSSPADDGPVDTAALLVADPAVQSDLKLALEQKRAIAQALEKVDRPIWVMRDWPVEKSRSRVRELIAGFEKDARAVLKPAQQRRLDEIILQYRGPEALLWPELAMALSLSDHQSKQVSVVIEDTRQRLEVLGKTAVTDDASRRKQYQAALEVKTHEQELLLAILTGAQKQEWLVRRGERFDLSQIGSNLVRAPELEDAEAKEVWLNSHPLTLAKLTGRVIVVHFWTFGCSNCIHNYPWYKNWQKDFADQDVTIIGIHTPETSGERNLETLRKKAEENGLAFPILVDNHRQNWDAWGNNVWPSVYLVDRKGRVRYWWYGELKWAGRDGEKLMRARIKELLEEKPEQEPQ